MITIFTSLKLWPWQIEKKPQKSRKKAAKKPQKSLGSEMTPGEFRYGKETAIGKKKRTC